MKKDFYTCLGSKAMLFFLFNNFFIFFFIFFFICHLRFVFFLSFLSFFRSVAMYRMSRILLLLVVVVVYGHFSRNFFNPTSAWSYSYSFNTYLLFIIFCVWFTHFRKEKQKNWTSKTSDVMVVVHFFTSSFACYLASPPLILTTNTRWTSFLLLLVFCFLFNFFSIHFVSFSAITSFCSLSVSFQCGFV